MCDKSAASIFKSSALGRANTHSDSLCLHRLNHVQTAAGSCRVTDLWPHQTAQLDLCHSASLCDMLWMHWTQTVHTETIQSSLSSLYLLPLCLSSSTFFSPISTELPMGNNPCASCPPFLSGKSGISFLILEMYF